MTDTNPTPLVAELLPCPFCLGEAKLDRTLFERPVMHWAKCQRCDASSSAYSKTSDAIATLNHRLAAEQAGFVEPMPDCDDRKPYDDLPGYMESDDEWLRRNPTMLTWLIDNHAAIRAALAPTDSAKGE